MTFRPLIRQTLQLITLMGLNPFFNTLIYGVYEKFNVAITIIAFIDANFILALTYRGINSIMEVLLAIAVTQVTIKMMFFFVNKVELKLLISNTNMFWKPNFVYLEQEAENEKIFNFAKSCMRLYGIVPVTICLLYLTKPLFFSEFGELPWNSSCSLFFSIKICFVYEVVQVAVLVSTVVSFDFFFISLNINIICELRLLKRHFSNLMVNPNVYGTDNKAINQIKKLIDHHNLILQCTNAMKHVYRIPLLIVFLSNMFGTCFSLIIITSSTTDNTLKLLFVIITFYYLIQLFYFCAFGSMLSDESEKITHEVYKSKWWIKSQPKLRNALIMVMRRANKPEILTAGGLLQVDLPTYTMILRSTFSFFTFIQVVYEDS